MSWLDEAWEQIKALPPISSKRAACAVVACDRVSQAKGLCTGHYNAARQLFDPDYRERYLQQQRTRRSRSRRGVAAPDAGGTTEEAQNAALGPGQGRAP